MIRPWQPKVRFSRRAQGTLRQRLCHLAHASRLGCAAVVGLILVALHLNLHLVTTQFIGWSGMLIEHQRETASWVESVKQTFGGEKPCNLCDTVQSAIRSTDDQTYAPLQRVHEDMRFFSGFLLLWGTQRTAMVYPGPRGSPALALDMLPYIAYVFTPEPPPPKRG